MSKSPAHEALSQTLRDRQLASVEFLAHNIGALAAASNKKLTLHNNTISVLDWKTQDLHTGWPIGTARGETASKTIAITEDERLWAGKLMIDQSGARGHLLLPSSDPISLVEAHDVLSEGGTLPELAPILTWPEHLEQRMARLMMLTPSMYDKQ